MLQVQDNARGQNEITHAHITSRSRQTEVSEEQCGAHAGDGQDERAAVRYSRGTVLLVRRHVGRRRRGAGRRVRARGRVVAAGGRPPDAVVRSANDVRGLFGEAVYGHLELLSIVNFARSADIGDRATYMSSKLDWEDRRIRYTQVGYDKISTHSIIYQMHV